MRITINNHEYNTGKLSAFDQFHIARRLAPVFASLAGDKELMGLAGSASMPSKEDIPIPSGVLAALAAIKDHDAEFIFNKCLEVCERKQSGVWARTRRDGVTMFELELPELLQICFHTLKENLANFTTGIPSLSALLKGSGVPKARA
jgi:hypothetical protein